jgi:hypothetical protein
VKATSLIPGQSIIPWPAGIMVEYAPAAVRLRQPPPNWLSAHIDGQSTLHIGVAVGLGTIALALDDADASSHSAWLSDHH